jgi:hypothetical protein
LNLSEAALLRFLPKAKMYGLCGMETRYSLYDGKTEARMTEIAHDFDLCESGGSDYHGKNKPDICLMRGRGTLSVPQIFSEGLRARIKNQ